MPSEAYDAVKLDQIKSESVTRIYGHPLEDIDQVDQGVRRRNENPFAVQWCLCVQDSPQSPCMCRPLIVWLTPLDVVSYGKTEYKDRAGESLYFFDITNDAKLLLERVQPIGTSAAKKIMGLSHGDVDRLLAKSTTLAGLPFNGPTTIADDPSPWLDLFEMLEDLGVFDSIDWQKFVKDQSEGHS
jgi:hypothetical protein